MNFTKKIGKLFKESFTFVVIPHNNKNTKQIKFNTAFILFIFVLFTSSSLFFVTATFYLHDKNTTLNDIIQIKEDEIKNLNIIVNQQKVELEDLRNTSKIVAEKLSQLYVLEDKVRNMVGLKNADKNKSAQPASRSFDRTNLSTDYNQYIELEYLTDDESIDTITSLIELQKDNYDKLIKDVEKQLKFLESKPDMWPVSGKITSTFGYRIHPISKRRHFHKGLDIANKEGTDIVAAGSGIVTYSGWNGGYGKVIIISHGYGYKSVYAHNKTNLVKVGDKVKKGQVIAKLGNTGRSTGPHIHFEIHFNGNQIDPLKVLKNK